MNNTRVYLSGNIYGSYRAQNIIKVLSDCNISFRTFSGYGMANNTSMMLVRKASGIIWQLLLLPLRVIAIAKCSHLFLLPMNFSLVICFEIFLARLFKKKVIVDYYISNFDSQVNDRKLVKQGSLMARWLLCKDRYILKSAAKVIFLNNAESSFYQKIAGINIPTSKIAILPLCIDYRKEMFAKNRQREDKSHFNVCWWGTYIPLHGLGKIIDAFTIIEDSSIKLHIFGNSDVASVPYQDKVDSLGLQERVFIRNNVTFSNGMLGDFLINECDLALGNFGDSEKAKTVLVNKIVDALSLSVPCLTQQTMASVEFLTDNESIKYCQATPADIASAIIDLKRNPLLLDNIRLHAMSRYLDVFSPEIFRERIINILID